ncbi:MAG: hypothetical protein LC746_09815 [Acidobacteria bacterium]|nr:hypothetical protein [Acidobacteriota bacterium]
MKKVYLVLAGVALVITLASAAAAQTDGNKGGMSKGAAAQNDIAGAWLVNLNFNAAGAAQAPAQPPSGVRTQAPFVAVETFHPDGTFIETSLTDYLPPQGPPGQGVWARTGEREFALTIYGVSVGSAINPQFQGTYKVRSKLTLSRAGDEFSGPFTVEIYDPSGALAASFDGTAQGRRARLDPLP